MFASGDSLGSPVMSCHNGYFDANAVLSGNATRFPGPTDQTNSFHEKAGHRQVGWQSSRAFRGRQRTHIPCFFPVPMRL